MYEQLNKDVATFEHESQHKQARSRVNLVDVFACSYVFATSFKAGREGADDGMMWDIQEC